ncbi:MAG: molybdopterin converting factor subunit 1 [Candidatus Glassbacteria bacterium]
MKITLKFFASLREACGRKEDTFEVPEGITVGELQKLTVEKYPELGELMDSTMPVVNMEYVEEDRVLKDHDDVTFIPPVSGG